MKIWGCALALALGLTANTAWAGYCGAERPSGLVTTPRHGIRVERNGFDESHPDPRCRIKLDYFDQAVDIEIARWATVGVSAGQVLPELRKGRVILRSDDGWYQTGVSWNGSGVLSSYETHISVTSGDGTAAFCFSGDDSSKPLVHEWDHVLAYVFRRSIWQQVGPGHLGTGIGYNINGTVMAPYSPQPPYQNYCVEPPTPQPTRRARYDFDGDGKADRTVFRPSNGTWHHLLSSGALAGAQFGMAGDRPAAADFDGDGKTDVAVYRPSTGVWYWLPSTGGFQARQWGAAEDLPVPADFNGDGKAELAVFRPSTGTWWVQDIATGASSATQWGMQGDIPLPGDYDGDGKADINVYRPNGGTWYRIDSSSGAIRVAQWGVSTDRPVSGDFDGDRKDDLAVYRPSTGQWWIIGSAGAWLGGSWGAPEDLPTAADYDGDGKADLSVWRPSTGVWWRINSADGAVATAQWGLPTDLPARPIDAP